VVPGGAPRSRFARSEGSPGAFPRERADGPGATSPPPGPWVASTRVRAVHVVPHTHWDREWYASFQHFRLKLVDLLDELQRAITGAQEQLLAVLTPAERAELIRLLGIVVDAEVS